MDWKQKFKTDGHVSFPALAPKPLVAAAMEAIQRDLQTNYDSAREPQYASGSYCPDLVGTPVIMNLFLKTPIYHIVDELLGIDATWYSKGQIAIRRAHNDHEELPPEPHLDGFATELNGVPPDRIYNHTLLVGVFLTPVITPFAGNFTVWPASHIVYARYFQERGERAMVEPYPRPSGIGPPLQLLCEPGDVVLAHYHLGHTAAVNLTDLDRVAVYFRVRLRAADADNWQYLTDLWKGWKL